MSEAFKLTELEAVVVSTFTGADGQTLTQVAADIVEKTGKAKRSVSGALGSLTKKGVLVHTEPKKGVKVHTLSEAYLEA